MGNDGSSQSKDNPLRFPTVLTTVMESARKGSLAG